MFEDLPLFIKETARKIIVSKFKFLNLKLWELTRLFAAEKESANVDKVWGHEKDILFEKVFFTISVASRKSNNKVDTIIIASK